MFSPLANLRRWRFRRVIDRWFNDDSVGIDAPISMSGVSVADWRAFLDSGGRVIPAMIFLLLTSCATVGGHYTYLPPEPVACALAATQAAVDQLPCDHKKPDPATCIAGLGQGVAALAPCLPRPVWVADLPVAGK